MLSLYKPTTQILEFYYVYMSNGLTFEIIINFKYNSANFLAMLGHDLEMACAKFLGNRYRIDREIDEKHALQIIVSPDNWG